MTDFDEWLSEQLESELPDPARIPVSLERRYRRHRRGAFPVLGRALASSAVAQVALASAGLALGAGAGMALTGHAPQLIHAAPAAVPAGTDGSGAAAGNPTHIPGAGIATDHTSAPATLGHGPGGTRSPAAGAAPAGTRPEAEPTHPGEGGDDHAVPGPHPGGDPGRELPEGSKPASVPSPTASPSH